VKKYAILLSLYGVALFIGGLATYLVSPPGANAFTALLIPTIGAVLAIACAVMSLMIGANRLLGMLGIHLGLVLPLVMALGAGARLGGSLGGAQEFNDQLAKLQEAAETETVLSRVQRVGAGEAAARKFVVKQESATGSEELFSVPVDNDGAWRPRGYQTVGIASAVALSAFAFIVLLMQRPSLPERKPRDLDRDDSV